MNSKDKGNIGESIIQSEFVKRGIQVSLPFGDNARYDQIADFGGKQNRIQVKYCNHVSANDSVMLCCSSSYNHTTNKRRSTYVDDVDYLAFYIPHWNVSQLIPVAELIGKKAIYIRKNPTKSGQQSGVHYIQDYSFDTTLCVETLHGEPKS